MSVRLERPLLQVPKPILAGFVLAFLMQLAVHWRFDSSQAVVYQPLARPLDTEIYRELGMGSPRLLSYWLNIDLQLHDNQSAQHFSYRWLDYDLLVDRLNTLSDLNPQSEYTLLLASRVYSQVGDKDKLRKILDYIYRRFDDNPELHWRRLAEASVIARHQLGDLEFALQMAKKIHDQPANLDIPYWARDLKVLLLAEIGELEAAIAIIQALIASNSIKDNDELRFLRQKLSEFQQTLFESQQNPSFEVN